MPPPGRYGPQAMNNQFPHLQQPQMAHHQPQQQQHHASQLQHGGLPPPSLTGNNGFGLGNSNINMFSMNGMNNAGLDARLGDGAGTGLGSQAAQMGFARGAQMQPSGQLRDVRDGQYNITSKVASGNGRIRDVWKHNLAQEMEALRDLVEDYPYISMDTEFPGIVARPIGSFTTKADYHYQTLRCNVDMLKMIQLGITLFSHNGETPPPVRGSNGSQFRQNFVAAPCTWQFNFKFSLDSDMYASESTTMLQKAGIDFKQHEKIGIEPEEFGALLMTSGLVLDPDVRWISFHSGYDFGYLMKLMICKPLPDDEAAFHELLMIFFPKLLDIKFLLKFAGRHQSVNDDQPLSDQAKAILEHLGTKSGLADIAEVLSVKRVGTAHQAGSDSLVTGEIYFQMREKVFNGEIDEEKYSGQVWGLNGQMPTLYSARHLETPNLNGAVIYNQGHTPGGAGVGGGPSTPSNAPANLVGSHTPGHMTPGGAFGQFQYAKA